MPETTTPNQAPLALNGARLGTRVVLTWASGDSEGATVGILESVHHELEPHWRGGAVVITRARLAEAPGYMIVTGWRVTQHHEPNTIPDN